MRENPARDECGDFRPVCASGERSDQPATLVFPRAKNALKRLLRAFKGHRQGRPSIIPGLRTSSSQIRATKNPARGGVAWVL